MSKSYKPVQRQTTLSAAIEDAKSELETLGEECRSASDNFPNQDHPKAQAFAEAADALEGISIDTDCPELATDLVVAYTEEVPRRKNHSPSRASRRGNTVAMLTAAKEVLEDWECKGDDVDDAQALANELDYAIGEAKGVEFPGLYG